jgi:hypothetical protein
VRHDPDQGEGDNEDEDDARARFGDGVLIERDQKDWLGNSDTLVDR